MTSRGQLALHALTSAMLALAGAGLAGPAIAQDAGAGAVVFKRCAVCHSVAGKPLIGPYLNSVVGRKSGTVPKFNYSKALVRSDIVWNKASLDKYLTKPQAMVPGTTMAFGGVPNAKDRQDLIAYLGSLKK